MKKVVAIAALLTASMAYGIGVGAGGFYALSMPIGDIADNYDMGGSGFGGKVMIGVTPYLNVDVGFGYHMKYMGKWEGISTGIVPPGAQPKPATYPEPDDVDDYYLTTIPITFGVSYPMKFDSTGIYFGGGGAFVMQRYNVGDSWTAPWSPGTAPFGYDQTAVKDADKPGFYVGTGWNYFFTEKIALDVNLRWMMVLDSEEDDAATTDVDESTSNSMYIDFLIGANYYFM